MQLTISQLLGIIFFVFTTHGLAQDATVTADMNISGKLIYGLGANLYSLSLSTGEKRVLLTRTGGGLQDGMTQLNNHQTLIGGSGDLVEYDESKGLLRILGRGDFPLVLPFHKNVFFYSASQGKRIQLVRSSLVTFGHSPIELIEAGPYFILEPLIAISEDDLVFLGGDRRTVWRYDSKNSELSTLPISNCIPRAWRAKTGQLLCWNQNSKSHFLTDLGGRNSEAMPELGNAIPIIYVEKFDALMVNVPAVKISLPEKYDLGVYFFASKRTTILAHDTLVAKGTAIWRE